jgi:eukaryotic-like serine/threonine-protein kinase
LIGAVIGSYQIVRKLGSGGMGAVYLGQHTLLGRRAAIKVLLPALSARQDVVRRFFNEARVVTSISDPGIVQVFDFGYHTDGSAFIVMEFLEGEPLDRRLAKLGKLSVHEALRLCRQIAGSLAAAHAQRIVHRDLKPENIFLIPDSEVASGERPKILDFGIAKLSDDHPGKSETHTGMLMGTPRYMSPEQCRGLAEIDHRADIYSLGCVMFHLLTGRPLFEGEGVGDLISAHIREPAPAPSSLVAGIPSTVDALVLRCLAKAPAGRFPSMTELAAAIGRLLSQIPVDAVLLHAPGTEGSVLPTVPPTYHTQLPVASSNVTVPTAPTTLGGSTGQLARSAVRSTRIGRRIAMFLVLAAVGAGIAIVCTPTQRTTRVVATNRDTEPGARGGNHGPFATGGNEVDAGATTPAPSVDRAPATGKPGIAHDDEAPADAAMSPPSVTFPPDAAPESTKQAAPASPPRALATPPPPAALRQGTTPESTKQAGPASPPRDHTSRAPSSPAPPPASAAKPLPSARSGAPSSPPAHAPPAAAAAPAPNAPKKCSKASFAAVYNAPAPSKEEIRAALHSLNLCHETGAITNDEYQRWQPALIQKH